MKTFPYKIAFVGVLLALFGATTPGASAPPKNPPRFVDNGDGTVTDNQTGLMWEKKTTDNVNNTYTWTRVSGGTAADGTLFTQFLGPATCTASFNGECGIADHLDWRIPNLKELTSIQDCSQPNCINPIFGATAAGFYWTSTNVADSDLGSGPLAAWFVSFDGVTTNQGNGKLHLNFARAVRGGK